MTDIASGGNPIVTLLLMLLLLAGCALLPVRADGSGVVEPPISAEVTATRAAVPVATPTDAP